MPVPPGTHGQGARIELAMRCLCAQPLPPRCAVAVQVTRSSVVDTETGSSKQDPIRTSYGAGIM